MPLSGLVSCSSLCCTRGQQTNLLTCSSWIHHLVTHLTPFCAFTSCSLLLAYSEFHKVLTVIWYLCLSKESWLKNSAIVPSRMDQVIGVESRSTHASTVPFSKSFISLSFLVYKMRDNHIHLRRLLWKGKMSNKQRLSKPGDLNSCACSRVEDFWLNTHTPAWAGWRYPEECYSGWTQESESLETLLISPGCATQATA